MYNRVLIANRGEIALRIIRACRELGIETIAVFSEADRESAHVRLADQAFCIGPARSASSYLKIDQVISAAEVGGADAIHPGYGFLAENSHFNEVVRSCQIDFIGPTPQAMEQLGDKNSARKIAQRAKVPVVPGSDGLIGSDEEAVRVAKQIGYPVLVKATAGGGGKGMRVAPDEGSLKKALEQARQEAEAAFGNAGIYLERFIGQPRHIEVQVIADHHGTASHLFERDCSVQRRHQKLIEEAPSPGLPEATRKSMCDAAVRLVHEVGYTNAGTVEFIVDQDNKFYFIEVNARIQVEHPVTEMITGIDLIKEQIRIASGERLSFDPASLKVQGAAIECRINAENSDRNFQPGPGLIERLFVPGGLGVRWDSHVYAGYTVPPYYDSMIAKLIVHRPTRDMAIECMLRALYELEVVGIPTTAKFHQRVLNEPAFRNGTCDTKWVERELLRNS